MPAGLGGKQAVGTILVDLRPESGQAGYRSVRISLEAHSKTNVIPVKIRSAAPGSEPTPKIAPIWQYSRKRLVGFYLSMNAERFCHMKQGLLLPACRYVNTCEYDDGSTGNP